MRYYMHSRPGKLRIKIPEIKGHPEKARTIQALLRDFKGVDSVRANVVTGDIVVKYEPGQLVSERILSSLKVPSLVLSYKFSPYHTKKTNLMQN